MVAVLGLEIDKEGGYCWVGVVEVMRERRE